MVAERNQDHIARRNFGRQVNQLVLAGRIDTLVRGSVVAHFEIVNLFELRLSLGRLVVLVWGVR